MKIALAGAALLFLIACVAAISIARADTARIDGGQNAVYTYTSSGGTTELRLGTLGNAADRKWWRLLWNATGDVEIQTCSDAGPCQAAQNRFNITGQAQVTTLTANGLQLTAPGASQLAAATGLDDSTATVRASLAFPVQGDGGGVDVLVKQAGQGGLRRAFGADNNGITSTGEASVDGLTRGGLAVSGAVALATLSTCPPPAAGQVRVCPRPDGTIAIVKPDGTQAVIATVP